MSATVNPDTVPCIVRARIFNAHALQEVRRRIARTLGSWYVMDERREPGRQAVRDSAAAAAREWRAVGIEHGHNPAAVRRAVLVAAGLSVPAPAADPDAIILEACPPHLATLSLAGIVNP